MVNSSNQLDLFLVNTKCILANAQKSLCQHIPDAQELLFKELNEHAQKIGLSNLSRLQKNMVSDFQWSQQTFMKANRNKLYIYKKAQKKATNQEQNIKSMANLKSKKFTGQMSERTKKKIGSIIDNWSNAIEYHNNNLVQFKKRKRKQLVFATLTLSSEQKHDDNYIKRNLLNTLLTKLRYRFDDVNYLWVAERQTKNTGRLHFHIIIDRYILFSDLAQMWDSVQLEHGYLSQEQINNHHSASTEIHGLKNVNNVAAYVSKYIQKDDSKESVKGRLWSCSRELAKMTTPEIHINRKKAYELLDMCGESVNSVHENPQFMVINFKKNINPFDVCEELRKEKKLIDEFNAQLVYTPKPQKCTEHLLHPDIRQMLCYFNYAIPWQAIPDKVKKEVEPIMPF